MVTDIHTATFRGHEYRFKRGTVHPQYSIDTFTDDESAFRERHWHPKAGDVVVDAGASYGAYSLTAAACGAKVYAFEPEPTVCVDLQANVALNDGDVRVLCAGLWDENDNVDMYSYAPHWPPGTISREFHMVLLDNWLADEKRVDIIKMDVEGAEERALRGARKTIAKFRPTIICEAHVFLDADLADKCEAVIREASGDTYSFERVEREPCVMVIGRPQ